MPPTSSGLSRKEGEGQLAFKPGFPSEEADNKASCQGLEVETGEAERRGGYVKLTLALNLSSRPRLDPISPRRPRTRWQGLSCRRHQWADEDSGLAGQSASQSLSRWVSPLDSCVTQQSSHRAEKTEHDDANLWDHIHVSFPAVCTLTFGKFQLFLLVSFSFSLRKDGSEAACWPIVLSF